MSEAEMYAIVSPAGEVTAYQSAPAITGKGWRCLPVVDVQDELQQWQAHSGPAVVVKTDTVERVWTAVPIVPAVPPSVTPYQARAALLGAGLLDAVEAHIAGAPETVRLAWEYAMTIERHSPSIAAVSAALDLTADQIDDLFRTAAGITA